MYIYVYMSIYHLHTVSKETGICVPSLYHVWEGLSGPGAELTLVPRIHSSYIPFRKRIHCLWAMHKAAQVVTFPSIPCSPGWTWDKFRPAGCERKVGEQSQGHVLLKGDYSLSTAFLFLPFLPEGWNEDLVVVTEHRVVLVQKQFCPPPPLAPGNIWRHILLSHDRGGCCWHLMGRDAVKCPMIHRNPPLPNKELLLLLFSCSVTMDSATPWTVACQAPLSMGFCKQEYWSGLPCPPPGDLPDPGIELTNPALAGRFCTTEPPVQIKNHPALKCQLCGSWEKSCNKCLYINISFLLQA